MAHLELAHLLALPPSKAGAAMSTGNGMETGQKVVAQSPSFGQWLRTSLLGHPVTGETGTDLKENLLVSEESLDSLDEEAVNVQALQDSQHGTESTNSDVFSTDDLQMAAANLQSDDSETGSETEISTSVLEQQAPIQACCDETEIISTPSLGTEKLPVEQSQLKKPITRIANNGVTVHSSRPFAGDGLANRSPCQEIEGAECLHDKQEERLQTTDKEPRIEMPWAGFSLFMESRAALQDVVSSREDPALTANKISGFGENEFMRAVPESMVLSENRVASPRRMEVSESNISPSAGLVVDSRLEESSELLSSLRIGEAAPAAASGDRRILERKVFIGPQVSAKIDQSELAPVNPLTPQKGNKLASAVIAPLVNNLRSESKVSGLRSEQLPNDADLERSERKPLAQLPVTPVGRIVSPETAFSVRPAIPSSTPIIPATPEAAATPAVIPTLPAASTDPEAFLTAKASSDSATLVIPSATPASVTAPVIPGIPPASATAATVPVNPATPVIPTLPAAPLSPTAPGVNPVAMATPIGPFADAVPVASPAVPSTPATPAPPLASAPASATAATVPATPAILATPILPAAPTLPAAPSVNPVAMATPISPPADAVPVASPARSNVNPVAMAPSISLPADAVPVASVAVPSASTTPAPPLAIAPASATAATVPATPATPATPILPAAPPLPAAPSVNPVAMAPSISLPADAVPVASAAVPSMPATPAPPLATAPASATAATVPATLATLATPILPAVPPPPAVPGVNPVAMATLTSPPADAVPVASPAVPNAPATPASTLNSPADAVPVASPAVPNAPATPTPTLTTAPASAAPVAVPATPATPATPILPAAPTLPAVPGVNPVAMATPTSPPADAVPVASPAVPNAPATPAPTLNSPADAVPVASPAVPNAPATPTPTLATAPASAAPAAVPATLAIPAPPTTVPAASTPLASPDVNPVATATPASPRADAIPVAGPALPGAAAATPILASVIPPVSAVPATIPATPATPTVSGASATIPATPATPLMSPPQTDSGTLAVIFNAPTAPPAAPNASLSATPATPTATSTLIAPTVTAAAIENDRINITAPDRTAVIQQTLPLGELRPQRRSRFAEPFADGAPKSTGKQSATDRLMASTTIVGDSLRTTRTVTHMTSDPAFDNTGWKTPSVNHNLPSHEATDRIDQQVNDAAVSSAVLGRKEVSAKAANVQSVEPNVPPVAGGTPTSAGNASPVAAIRTETPSSTWSSTLPETLDLRQSHWGRALGHQLNWMVNHRMQEAEIRVNPPQLGPLEVRMSLHQNQTNVTFFCHDAAVREAIESAIPRLREMLDSQGISLNQAQVSDQSLARQQAGSGEQSSHNPRDGRPSASHQPDPELPSQETQSRPRPNLSGTVDDYA